MIAIFANSPFDKETRVDCEMIKIKKKKNGEICILPNYNNSIFDIENAIIEIINKSNTTKIKINNSAVVTFENNNFICFGLFEELK